MLRVTGYVRRFSRSCGVAPLPILDLRQVPTVFVRHGHSPFCSRTMVNPETRAACRLNSTIEVDELDGASAVAAALINLCCPSYLRDGPTIVQTRAGDYGVAFSAPCVKARPVAEMSSPAPAVV